MESTFKKIFQVILIILILALMLSTFVPQVAPESLKSTAEISTPALLHFLYLDRFYSSPLNVALWGLLVLLILVAVILGSVRRLPNISLHLLLALILIAIFFEKISNQKYIVPITEGETIQLTRFLKAPAIPETTTLQLQEFKIQYHPNSRMPKAFNSHLVINGQDTTILSVNKPLALANYRLYQEAYDVENTFKVQLNDTPYEMILGDTVFYHNKPFVLKDFNHSSYAFQCQYAGKEYQIFPDQNNSIADIAVKIKSEGQKYISIIKVAEVGGTKLILFLALVYLINLGYLFWRREK